MFPDPQSWFGTPFPFDPSLWTDLFQRMMTATLGGGSGGPSAPPDAFRELRSMMLSAWGKYFDQVLRSPWFMEMMRQTLNTNIELRRQMTEALGKMHHELQGVSRQDVDQLMRSLRHLEHRIADGLERLNDRLDDLERRLAEQSPSEKPS